jgi:hypothetical protein
MGENNVQKAQFLVKKTEIRFFNYTTSFLEKIVLFLRAFPRI